MRRLVLAAAVIAAPAAAQAPAAPPAATATASPALNARIAELPGLIAGTVAYADYFAPSFRAAISAEAFATVVTGLRPTLGAFRRVEAVTPRSADSAEVRLAYANGTLIALIAVDPAAAHQVTGLRLMPQAASEATLDAIAATLATLPGRTGFVVAKLGEGAPAIVAGKDVDTPLGVGSAFKLVILAELVRATATGERHWDDLVTLDGTPLPGGGYTSKPAGTRVSLRELATQMISISDNSATDILLRALGRAKVEAMLPTVGVADPARDRPFLSTLEMFKLKGVAGLGDRYLALDEAARRTLLDGEVARLPLSAIDETRFRTHQPYLIDRIEWFFSPADLVRVMDWLRRHTESGPAAEARAILATNPGVLPVTRERWRYIGFKGGSEPGVVTLTQLLQAADGAWYVTSIGWNDPAHEVDTARAAALLARADDLAGR